MKRQMKTRLVLGILFSISTACVLGLPAVLLGGQGLLPVKGTGTTFLTGPVTADGFGTIIVGGETYDVYVHVDVGIMLNRGKSIHVTATHTFRTGPAEDDPVLFVTNDSEILAPSGTDGVFILNGHSQVAEGGTGHLVFHGTLNFVTGEVSLDWHGAMRLTEE